MYDTLLKALRPYFPLHRTCIHLMENRLEKDKDRYGRIVAVCSVAGLDLNRWLVQQGLAVAYLEYSKHYAGDETKARAAKVGLWSGVF